MGVTMAGGITGGTATTMVATDITTVAADTGTADGILTGSAPVGDVIRIRVLGYGLAIDQPDSARRLRLARDLIPTVLLADS